MPNKAPIEIFKNTVQFFPMFAVNILLLNKKNQFLLVKRKANPAKGLYYFPGGRMLNGETIRDCAERILKEELGVTGHIKYISREYLEEIWPTSEFGDDFGPYKKETRNVHYISTMAVAETDDQKIKLDFQSKNFSWFEEMPDKPPMLHSSIALVRDYLKANYSIDI